MRISAINIINTGQTNFLRNEEKYSQRNSNSKKIMYGMAGICTLGFGGAVIYKASKKSAKKVVKNEISEADKKFYNNIADGLKKLGIDVKADSLKSIVGPDEFKTLVKKFRPEHYRAGLQISEAKANGMSLDEFYKNAVDGNFRVSLHTHSNFSDGKSTPEEFLECSRKYADKVAKMNKNDGLPPFTIALTDHDSIDGCIEIIKLIARDSEKYKNLKFVTGCEFSVADGTSHHDITGLALNPFDDALSSKLNKLRESRRMTVQGFLDNRPEYNGKKVTIADLAEAERLHYAQEGKDGKRSIENGSGVVSVRHALKFYYKYSNQTPDKDLINQLGEKDIPKIEDVVSAIVQNGGYASLTHPLKSFWRYIGDDALMRLKNMGVSGIEVNHQYTPSKVTKIGKINHDTDNADIIFNNIIDSYRAFAEMNDMIMTGGTDCHEKQIFSRQPKITEDFLNSKLLN